MPRPPSNAQHLIIEAAYAVLAVQGFEAASIKEIAKAAGVAPGLVHYYFKNKEELLLAVLREASAKYTRQMQGLSVATPAEHLNEAALQEPKNRVEQQPEFYRLRFELFALGLRNPAITPGLAELLATGRQGIAHVLEASMRSVTAGGSPSHATASPGAAPLAPAPQADPQLAAALLLACFDGLALQQLADPTFDLAGAYQLLFRLAAPLVSNAR